MAEVINRLLRSRRANWSRRMVREAHLSVDDLIWPLFICEVGNKRETISAMPGVERFSIDLIVEAAKEAEQLGIPAIALFPKTPADKRSDNGDEALNADNLINQAMRAIKAEKLNVGIIADVALDPYTSHGQDGLVDADGAILNDKTVTVLAKQALVQAQAGADIIAPSDMMDGRVAAIRQTLDDHGFENVQIMSYAAKYASGFYGPFREAVGANLKGDKKTYQMDPANSVEALREVEQDILEGADSVIVKPGMPYLDIVSQVKSTFNIPVYAYQVSGEYAMMQAAAKNGWLDLDTVMMESLLAFKRAGADGILTYFARDVAKKLNA